MHLSIIDFCFAPKLLLPINCSHRDNINSDFNITGFAPSPYSLFISIAFIWFGLVADIFIISPPSAFIKGVYSCSGSIQITSEFLSLNIVETISSFAVNDLPLPLTPKINELPFNNFFLSAIIIFFDITFCP